MTKDELIAHYFSNTLSPSKKVEFDRLMIEDREFARTVEFEEHLKVVITKEEQTVLKQKLQSLEFPKKKSSKPYIKWLVAACAIMLLAIPSIWHFSKVDVDHEMLFAKNFEPFENVVHPIVRGDAKTNKKTNAFIAYQNRDYDKALVLFSDILKDNSDASVAFYKANVLLQLNRTNEAIAILSNNNNLINELKPQQQWYLALAYLKLENNEKAKSTLEALLLENKFKTEQAKELIEKIN